MSDERKDPYGKSCVSVEEKIRPAAYLVDIRGVVDIVSRCDDTKASRRGCNDC